MALRSLVAVMLKALPRRMPGSGAFAPKGNPWSKSSAKLTGPTKESNLLKTQIEQRLKLSDEAQQKYGRVSDLETLLLGVGTIGYLGYVASRLEARRGAAKTQCLRLGGGNII